MRLILFLVGVFPVTDSFTGWSSFGSVHHHCGSPALTLKTGQRWMSSDMGFDFGGDEEMDEPEYSLEEANQRSVLAEKRVSELEQTVDAYKKDIEEKERQLKESGNAWALEKTRFVARIAEFTNLLQRKDSDTDKAQKIAEQSKQAQQDLEQAIAKLRQSLSQAEASLAMEKERADELKSRLLNAEDQLEFEQMRFDKEKKKLGNKIDEERSRFNNVAIEYEREKRKFYKERGDLQRKIEAEASELARLSQQKDLDKARYEQEKSDLLKEIDRQRKNVSNLQDKLRDETDRFGKEQRKLELDLKLAQEKLAFTENLLVEKQRQFERERDDLSTKLANELARVEDMKQQMVSEQKRYQKEKSDLEGALSEERTKLVDLEATLQAEISKFDKERRDLKLEISEGVRTRQLKAKQMNERFTAIRTELTGRWEGAKRDARQDREKMKKKYEAKLTEITRKVTQLEANLSMAEKSNKTLKELLDKVTSEKHSLLADQRRMEASYLQTIANKNGEISSLKMSVEDLEVELRDRAETIQRYETSYKELLKLSFRLTRARLRKSRSRIFNLVRRKPKGQRD